MLQIQSDCSAIYEYTNKQYHKYAKNAKNQKAYLNGSTLFNISAYCNWAVAHLTKGPQAKEARLTFS